MTTPTRAGAIWPARLAYAAAGLFTSASGTTNLLYGIAKGTDLATSLVWGAVSLAVSIVFALSWPAVLHCIDAKRWARAAMVGLALLLTGAYSVSAALGSAMGGRTSAATAEKDAGDRKARAQDAYDAAKAELDRLATTHPAGELQALLSATRRELAALQPSRSVAELDALLTAARRDPRRYDCAAVNGSLAIACPKLASERARAARRMALEAQVAPLAGQVAAAEKRLQESRQTATEALQRASAELARSAPAKVANTDAVALATYLRAIGISVDVERANRLLTLLAVLVIECGGGLALTVRMALSEAGRSGQTAEDSVQTPKTAKTLAVDTGVDAVDPCAQVSRQVRPGVQTAGREGDIASWLRAQGGRALTSMRRLAAELGRSHAGVHIEVGRLVAAGVLTALPSARGTVLTLAGRLN